MKLGKERKSQEIEELRKEIQMALKKFREREKETCHSSKRRLGKIIGNEGREDDNLLLMSATKMATKLFLDKVRMNKSGAIIEDTEKN